MKEVKDRSFQDKIASLAEGLKKSKGRKSSLLYDARMLGIGGWLVALPVAGGAYIGLYLDRRAGGGIMWTLAFLALGLALGLFNVWHFLLKKDGR